MFAHGKLIAMGGETETGRADPYVSPGSIYRQVIVYNPSTALWTNGPQLPIGVHGMQPVFHTPSNTVFVTGGGVIAGYSQSRHLQVLSATQIVAPPAAPTAPRTVVTTYNEMSPRGCCRTSTDGSGDQATPFPASEKECKSACTAQANCFGFEYHMWESTCELHASPNDFHHTSGYDQCQCFIKVETLVAATPAPVVEPTVISFGSAELVGPVPTGHDCAEAQGLGFEGKL
jgi:hypothetical protein